jgi:hypothetical protein
MAIEVLSRKELVRRAGNEAKARLLVREGAWRKVFRDAYVAAHVPDDTSTRVAALRAVLPSDVAVSHRTALWLYGCDVLGSAVQFTVPRGRHLVRREGFEPWSALLPGHELCEVGGLLVVSAARAVVDVARRDELVEAVVVADVALRRGVTSAALLTRAVEDARGLRYVEKARTMLPHVEPRSESHMETRLRMRLVLGGVPRPEAQWDVYTDEGHLGRADLFVEGVLIEYDGRAARLNKEVFVADRRRASRLLDTGLELRRFTSADYYRRPAPAVCADVFRALELARGKSFPSLRTGPDTLPRPKRRPWPTRAQLRAA